MRKIVGIMLCSLLVTTCDILENKDDSKAKNQRNALLLLAAAGSTGSSAANVVQNVVATSTATKAVTLTWDAYSGAVIYNIYYTCSTSNQASTVPAATTVTDPTVVATSTGAVTASGVTTGTEACSATVVNIVKGITPGTTTNTATVTVQKLGLPYKFIVTAVTGATGTTTTETAASAVATLAEAAPTQAQRLRGIYIVGGMTGAYGTQVSAVDMYDADGATWYSAITSLPTPVSFAGIGSQNSKIVVVGGFDSTGANSNKTQVYNIIASTWADIGGGGGTNKANMGVASFNGKLYFIGGSNGATATFACVVGNVTNTINIYDTSTDTWLANGVNIATASFDRAAAQIGGVIYFNGGKTLPAAPIAVGVTQHDGYVIGSTPGITVGAEVPYTVTKTGHSLVGYSSTTDGSEMWSIGGVTANLLNTGCGNNVTAAATTAPITTVETLKAPFQATAIWVAGPSLATATAYGSAVVDSRNGNVYYTGGNTTSTSTNVGVTTFIKSNIVTKAAWTTLTAMPNARWGHTAVIPNQ